MQNLFSSILDGWRNLTNSYFNFSYKGRLDFLVSKTLSYDAQLHKFMNLTLVRVWSKDRNYFRRRAYNLFKNPTLKQNIGLWGVAYDSYAGILSFVIYFTRIFGFGNLSDRATCKALKKSEAKLGFTAFKAALVNDRKKSAPIFSFHIFLYFFASRAKIHYQFFCKKHFLHIFITT